MTKKKSEINTPVAIEMLDILTLIAYSNNPRTHTDTQIDKLAASIKEFGFTNPILITDDNVIIAGHGRLLAAQKIGMLEAPCIRLSHLTDAQRRAYIIADNRLALDAGWDTEVLQAELQRLQEEPLTFDLKLTGFDDDQLEKFLKGDTGLDLDDPSVTPKQADVETYHCPKCGFEFNVEK